MIPYTALCRYPPLRFSRAAKTPVATNFQISRIEAELGVPTCNNINTVNSVINRKKNDAKRCLISRELPLNKGTLFLQKSKLHCIPSSSTIRSWRKFRKFRGHRKTKISQQPRRVSKSNKFPNASQARFYTNQQ